MVRRIRRIPPAQSLMCILSGVHSLRQRGQTAKKLRQDHNEVSAEHSITNGIISDIGAVAIIVNLYDILCQLYP